MGKNVMLLTLGAAMMALVSCGVTTSNSSSENKGSSSTSSSTPSSSSTGVASESSESSSSATSSGIETDPLAAEMLLDFSSDDHKEVFASDGWTNGGSFNCVWSKKNMTFSDNQMHLAIKEEKKTAWLNDQEVEFPYSAGEARTHHHYGPGDYEVRMKPTDVVGSVSSFFVCTGNYDKVDGVENPWDEVDIEFLGKDTTHVQFNYFVNGQGGHEYMHDLGFDASKGFHNYGFRWNEESITWFVDGVAVYQVKATKENPLPTTPGRIMTNYWPSSAEGWSGKFEGDEGKTCDYEWIKAKGDRMLVDGESDPYAEPEIPTETFDWTKVDTVDLTFTTEAEEYDLAKNEGVTTVTYQNVGGSSYKTINADLSSVGADTDAVRFLVKNEGNDTARVRANLLDPALSEQQNKCANVSATKDGVTVYTDTAWGGSFFELEPNETAECVVKYTGSVNSLEFMVDSAWNDGETRTGQILLSEFKFAKMDAAESNLVDLAFTGNDRYTVNPDNTPSNSVEVTYTDVPGNVYSNIGAYIGDVGANKNTFSLDIENKGNDDVRFRADVQGPEMVGETKAINTNAYVIGGGSDIYTDTTWGGSFVTVAAGEKVTFVISYDTTTDRGNVNYLCLFIDSARGNAETYSGHLVLSNFAFSLVSEAAGTELSFASNEIYTVTPSEEKAESVEITYTGVAGNSYANVNSYIGDVAAENNTFSLDIENKGEADVRFRADIQGTTKVGDTDAINTNAYTLSGGSDIYTDTNWGGSFVTVAAGEKVTFVISYDATTDRGVANNVLVFLDSARGNGELYSGDVVLSNFVFSSIAA